MAKKTSRKKTKKKKTVKKKTATKKKPSELRDQTDDPPAGDVKPYPRAGSKIDEFEAEIDRLRQQPTPTKQERKETRGRPKGSNKEKSRKKQAAEEIEKNLADAPIELIADFIKMPFEMWSSYAGLKQIRLSDAEAKRIAIPAKQLFDYYMPKIPPIAYAWSNLTITAYFVVKPRMDLIQEARAKKSANNPAAEAAPDAAARPAGFKTNYKPEKI